MPHLIWSRRALYDLGRLEAFLSPKSQRAAEKAIDEISSSALQLTEFPAIGRPVEGLDESYRDLVIPFGISGYILRYRIAGDDVVVVAHPSRSRSELLT